MGFFNTLEKFVNGASDIFMELMEHGAKGIDRMSDEEIERRNFKPAKMIRRDASVMSDGELKRKYSREASEVKRDASNMSDREIERKYSKSADEVRMQADMMRMHVEMYKMRKEEFKIREEQSRMEKEWLRENNRNREISEHTENDKYDDCVE